MSFSISPVEHADRQAIAYGYGDDQRGSEIYDETKAAGLLLNASPFMAGFLDDVLAKADAPAPKLLFAQGQVANPADPGDLAPDACLKLADFLDARTDTEITAAMLASANLDDEELPAALAFMGDLRKLIRAAADHKGLRVE